MQPYNFSIGYRTFLVDPGLKKGYLIKLPDRKVLYRILNINGRELEVKVMRIGFKPDAKIVEARIAHKPTLAQKEKEPVPRVEVRKGDNKEYSFYYVIANKTLRLEGTPADGEILRIGNFPRHAFVKVRKGSVDEERKIFKIDRLDRNPSPETASSARFVSIDPDQP